MGVSAEKRSHLGACPKLTAYDRLSQKSFPQISQITQIAGAKNNGIHGKKICVICENRGRQKYSRVTGIIRPLCLQSWERNPLNVKFKSKLYSLMDVSSERRSHLGTCPKLTAYMMLQNIQNYFTAFIEGYICAIIGERLTTATVTDAELDNAKRAAEKYVELQIEYSDFSDEEKDAVKKNYRFWAESTLQGMKRRLRESGRLS